MLEGRDKNNDPPLTVALDCTIDYINSNKVKNLLEEFKEEIQNGTLNFVFFKSGQKFDMFGMDNYYGAPFFMVNNSDPKWETFKAMSRSPGIQTDILSEQWFCLAYKYASEGLDDYRRLIFENSREILKNCPDSLRPKDDLLNQRITVSQVDDEMDVSSIDIKVRGGFHKLKALALMARFYLSCIKHGVKTYSRASFGFFHPNFIVIMIQNVKDSTTIRLSPGINPRENKFIIEFLNGLTSY